jgi:pseudouridine-5'-phosphate glycosidase
MEYPVNRDTALSVEEIIRNEGAMPATIAIVNGVVKIGLDYEDIDNLAKGGHEGSRKTSRRYIK